MLQQLFLHKNQIGGLQHCEVYLPPCLVTLTLAANRLTDLNHVSHLGRLTSLREFSIAGNPCVLCANSPVYPSISLTVILSMLFACFVTVHKTINLTIFSSGGANYQSCIILGSVVVAVSYKA